MSLPLVKRQYGNYSALLDMSLDSENTTVMVGTRTSPASAFDFSYSVQMYDADVSSYGDSLITGASLSLTDTLGTMDWSGSTGDAKGLLCVGSANGNLTIYGGQGSNIASYDRLFSEMMPGNSITSVKINQSNQLIAISSMEGEINILKLGPDGTAQKQNATQSGRNTPGGVNVLAWNPEAPQILGAASGAGQLHIFDARVRREVMCWKDPGGAAPQSGLIWPASINTQVVVAYDSDTEPKVQCWDLRNHNYPIGEATGHQRGIKSLAALPGDSRFLVSGGRDNRVVTYCLTSTGLSLYSSIQTPAVAAAVTGLKNQNNLVAAVCQGHQAEDSLCILNIETGRHPDTSFLVPEWQRLYRSNSTAAAYLQMVQNKSSDHPIAKKYGTATPIAETANRKTPQTHILCGFAGISVNLYLNSAIICQSSKDHSEILNRATKFLEMLQAGDAEKYCIELARALNYTGPLGLNSIDASSPLVLELAKERADQIRSSEKKNTEVSAAAMWAALASRFDRHDVLSKVPEILERITSNNTSPEMVFADDSDNESQQPGHTWTTNTAKSTSSEHSMFSMNPKLDWSTPELYQIKKEIVLGNLENAVSLCMSRGLLGDGLLIAGVTSSAAWKDVLKEYARRRNDPMVNQLLLISTAKFDELISTSSTSEWKETLTALSTYTADASPTSAAFEEYATSLGDKLLVDAKDVSPAALCYLLAGTLPQTIRLWSQVIPIPPGPSGTATLLETCLLLSLGAQVPLNNEAQLQLKSFAEMLTNSGAPEIALSYINHIKTDQLLPQLSALQTQLVSHLRTSQKCAPAPKSNPPNIPAKANFKNNINQASIPQSNSIAPLRTEFNTKRQSVNSNISSMIPPTDSSRKNSILSKGSINEPIQHNLLQPTLKANIRSTAPQANVSSITGGLPVSWPNPTAVQSLTYANSNMAAQNRSIQQASETVIGMAMEENTARSIVNTLIQATEVLGSGTEYNKVVAVFTKMYDYLVSGSCKPSTSESIVNLIEAITSQDYTTANSIRQRLSSTEWSANKEWLTALRRVMAKL